MTLADHQIKAAILRGEQISVTPFWPEHVQPCSLDFILDRHFLIPQRGHRMLRPTPVRPWEDCTQHYEPLEIPEGGVYWLQPGEFILGSTFEVIKLGNKTRSIVNGKSTLGRLGIIVHATAGFIDPGFHGHITLEICNFFPLPVALKPGMRIGQLEFTELSSPCELAYGDTRLGSHYQGQRGPTAPRGHVNFKLKDVYYEASEVNPSIQAPNSPQPLPQVSGGFTMEAQ